MPALRCLSALSVAAVWLCCPVFVSADEDDPRPNIVLIMADDMGYECLSCNGSESYTTPNLDRLAAGGMRFENCHSQPICTPTRVQIMTGQYNQRNYIRFGVLDPGQTTFGHLMQNNGYKTCIVGKWQLEGGFKAPNQFGFDEYCLWQLTRRPGRYPNPGLEINGKTFDYTSGEYGPDIVSDFVCDFIERRHKDGPFFAYYPMILPHWPFEPTPDGDDWDPKAKGVLNGVGNPKYFKGMVEYTDKVVGKIVSKLDDLGIRDNTLVIFTGDNGTATQVTTRWQGRAVKGGKGGTTNFGTHVPMIASWPGKIAAGKVNPHLVDFTDVLPTLVEASGNRLPPSVKVDGRSFLRSLTSDPFYEPREWIYCWYARNGGKGGKEFAHNGHYKLYRDGRLFNLHNDDLEKTNLAGKKERAVPAKTVEMLQSVLDKMEGTRVMLPEPYRKKKKKKDDAKKQATTAP